jgi:glutaconate CoA-transferase subunit B
MSFDEDTGLMGLESLHAGVALDDVRANTGYNFPIPGTIPETESPTTEQVDLIRDRIDP